jgi:integrase
VLSTYKRPKPLRRRQTVKLFRQAYEGLLRQKARTALLPACEVEVAERHNRTVTTEALRFVLLNSTTGKPFTDAKALEKFWRHHLRQAGLRHRGTNQCRHTFASRLLTTGKYPEKWIADYLGHTSTSMLHRHYGALAKPDRPPDNAAHNTVPEDKLTEPLRLKDECPVSRKPGCALSLGNTV